MRGLSSNLYPLARKAHYVSEQKNDIHIKSTSERGAELNARLEPKASAGVLIGPTACAYSVTPDL